MFEQLRLYSPLHIGYPKELPIRLPPTGREGMGMKRAVLLDGYGTLIKPLSSGGSHAKTLARYLQVPIEQAEAAWRAGRDAGELGRLPPLVWLSQICQIAAGRTLGYSELQELYDLLVANMIEAHEVYPHARGILEECRAARQPVGILSTTTPVGRDVAQYFGLLGRHHGGLVTATAFSCDMHVRKPDLDAYRLARKATSRDYTRDQYAFFDDTLECVAGAVRYGMVGVLVLQDGGSTFGWLHRAGRHDLIRQVVVHGGLIRWPIGLLDPFGDHFLDVDPGREIWVTTNLPKAVRELALTPGSRL